MAPVLTEPDKDPESPRTPAASPRHPRRLGRHLHALLKSNLKNLLADCGAQLDVCAAGGLHDFSPPDVGAMKNVLGEHCKPTNGIMDSEKLEKEDVMGLHSANSSNLQELMNNKKQLTASLVASSPPAELADMIHEFEALAESAPLTSGNGHVPPEEMQMITQLVTSMDENPPVAAVVTPSAPPPVAAPPPPAVPSSMTVEATQARQTQLVSRSARLLRRLCALQARTARRQTTSQTSALLERLSVTQTAPVTAATSTGAAAAAGAAAPTSSLASPAAAGAGAATTAASGDITEMLRSPNAKHFSTTQLVNLVLNNKSATAAAATATTAPPPPPPPPSEVACSTARVEREVAAAAARPAGVARRQVERLLSAADSDATESSSGGESGDEFEPGWDDEALERAAPIRKRALWRWATERSALACRWSWLAAQVTDLEFRVRQLRQLHRQLRATNPRTTPGRAVRPAAPAPAPAPARELGGAGDACSGAVPEHDKASEVAHTEDGDGQCARTRQRPAASRRRVFSVARAALRPAGGAPARCHCDPGLDSCTTCAGRLDPGVRVRPESQPVRERRALLAAGHHPVLSLPAEAALSLGYDALLRSPRWQQNHLHARPRGPRLVTKEVSGVAAAAAASAAPGAGGGTTPAGMPSSTVSTPPVPITPCSRPSFQRRKSGVLKRFCELEGGGGELSLGGSNGHGHGRVGRPPKLCRRSRSASASVCDARPAAGAGPHPLDDDPAWTPGRQSPERRESRERSAAVHRAARHRQNSYDIDNIVIPASMASTTKIEKPKYKEIVTPGWRPVELRPAAAVNGEPAPSSRSPSVSPEPLEPLDDAAFERRHLPAELEERRRLYQAAGKPPGGTAAGGGGAGGSSGPGRGRHAQTPDTPRAADAGADVQRPRILRYMYSLEPCGFPGRQFPLSDRVWKELQTSTNSEDSALHGWRSPRSRSVTGGGSAESALGSEDHRSTK